MAENLKSYWSNKWFLCVASGLLLGAAFPPLPFPFLLFPAWILLYRLAELSESKKEAAWLGFIAFVIWNLITTYWLMMATPAGGVAAILANSAVMTLPFVLQRHFQKRFASIWLVVPLQAAAWISYEYLHHQWDLAWPWLALGNAWSNVPSLVQYISVTGHLGISFWVLAVSGTAYRAIVTSHRNTALAAFVLALLFPAVSLVQYQTVSFNPAKSIETVVAQPNFDTYLPYGGYGDPHRALKVLIDISDSVRTDSTALIVWPESGIQTPIYSRRTGNTTAGTIKENLLEQAVNWDATLIAGAVYLEYYAPGEAPALSRRGGTDPYLYYNAALGFYPDRTYEIYRKHNLVPLVERIPFVHFLNAVDLFGWVGWTDLQGYGKGYDPDQFSVNGTATPALVCYDSVFPGWVRQYVSRGAGFITVITNDGWWGDTSGHLQHFAYARLRAIEFRRWVVRSANNGISGIIDPMGAVRVETDYWEKTAFRYRVPVLDRMTIYARWGNWLPAGMTALAVLGLALSALRNRKSNRENRV